MSIKRFMAIHEAGHAVVAMYTGKNIKEIRIDVPEGDPIMPDGGGYCLNYKHANPRSWHACSCLAGVFATRLFCTDYPPEWSTWEHCHEDMRLFNAERKGMTYRQARRITLGVLGELKHRVMELADILERDGFVDYTNAPHWERL